jgi:glucosamine-6-phosphate deaminase
VRTDVFGSEEALSRSLAGEIAELVARKAASGERCVLGLATGSSPIGVYEQLVRLHRQEGVSFANVVVFTLDEYWPMDPAALQSYRRFMDEHQTSGNIAVFDHDALRFADFAVGFNRIFGIDAAVTAHLEKHVEQFLRRKRPGEADSPEVQRLKSLIRRSEARAAGRSCGIPVERLHFLDMPFYETGRVRKRPLGQADIDLLVALLRRIRPHQIFAAGDLSDPHGTHRVCLRALERALIEVRSDDWFGGCEVWLYRGAWQEWEPDRIDMAVPLGPRELRRKRDAIFRHQSQKDRAMFPGPDPREFWQRAEDRNRATARLYDQLGLAEYEAIEAFVRLKVDVPLPAAPSA